MKYKLPSSFVIKHDSENPLWDKYIKWLNETYEWEFEGIGSQYYYGYYFRPIVYRKEYLPAEITILTLDQWHTIAYPEYEVVMVVNKPSEDIYFNTIQQAVQNYGEAKQVDMWFEESSELTKALCKHRRNPTEQTIADIREEIEDVAIMLDQLRLIYCEPESSYDIKYKKIERLYNRLNPTTHD